MYYIPWGPHHPLYFDTAEEFFGIRPVKGIRPVEGIRPEDFPDTVLAADLDRWSGVQHWTLEEGVALSYGFDPRVVNSRVLLTYPEHPYVIEYDKRMGLAQRAVVAGQLSSLSPPRRFIKWAESVGIIFPPTLSQMVNSFVVAKRIKRSTTSVSGLKTRTNKLSRIALGISEFIYGFDPRQPNEQEYEEMVADLRVAGISVTIESIKRCLKTPEDLYEKLSEVEETLGKVVLGIAICHFEHDPRARRSGAPKRIAAVVGSVDVDTIRARLKETAATIGLA